MIKWLKRNQGITDAEIEAQKQESTAQTVEEISVNLADKPGLFERFKLGLTKTRQHMGSGISKLFLGKKEIDSTLLEELETLLLSADVGVDTAKMIVQQLNEGLARKQLSDGDAVFAALKTRLQSILTVEAPPLSTDIQNATPFVLLMVGVNGAGKTTTIGKLAKQFQQQGKKVMLAAGDTFRAAAVEQLQVWGERNQIPVIAQHTGADSASVIYDAVQAAKARNMDILIADTAGRLHTQHNLMEELKKVIRVIKKLDPQAPHEIMLILDASIGQNALNQARQFHKDVGVTGVTMTKLDGTAKGGILFAIAHELEIPFRYVGIGEGVDDLRSFDPAQFVEAIFNDDNI
jgi:fused signal recognition particle receptor